MLPPNDSGPLSENRTAQTFALVGSLRAIKALLMLKQPIPVSPLSCVIYSYNHILFLHSQMLCYSFAHIKLRTLTL